MKPIILPDKTIKNVVVLDFDHADENDALCRYLDKNDIKDIGEMFDADTCKIKIRMMTIFLLKSKMIMTYLLSTGMQNII